jgi:chromate transporter
MAFSTLLNFKTIGGGWIPDIRGIMILSILVAICLVFKKVRRKKPSPILMILISAGLGMLLYAI